jgi:hypothetical protein
MKKALRYSRGLNWIPMIYTKGMSVRMWAGKSIWHFRREVPAERYPIALLRNVGKGKKGYFWKVESLL